MIKTQLLKGKKPLMLLLLIFGMSSTYAQLPGAITYDFTDGAIIENKQSADGKLTLGGDYTHHGTDYGLNLKVDQTISIQVDGSSTIRFLGSEYSSLKMEGTAVEAGDLGTLDTKVATDKVDTYDFVYSGTATTLTFKTVEGTGNDTYLPQIEVIPSQSGGTATSVEENIAYYFDLRDESIVPSSAPGNTTIEEGLFKIEAGCCNAYGYHGSQHGITYKEGNKITLQVAGNSYIRLGGDQYSGGTITASSSTGDFDVQSQNHQTTSTYSDGTPIWVDFLYVGDSGTVTFESSGSTNYLPFIEISPVPYEVALTSWAQKSGTITVKGVDIGYTAGADASSSPDISTTDGFVMSSTTEQAVVYANLGGNKLSALSPSTSGDIESVAVQGDSLLVTLADSNTAPTSYVIRVKDNSIEATPKAGTTYSYNIADGSVMPDNTEIKYSTFITEDELITMNKNEGSEIWWHDGTHGMSMYDQNAIDFKVAGDAIITFTTCTYSADEATFVLTNTKGDSLGTVAAENNGGADGHAVNFSYEGDADTITATLKAGGTVYIHALSVANAAAPEPSNGKIDVWDFGGAQLDSATYNNRLSEEIINGWYDESTSPGTAGVVLPSNFTAGPLSWSGGGNDRLRTSNTSLSRYDENLSGVADYTGRIYVNSEAATGRYMSLSLNEDDEVTLMMLAQNATGNINFEYVANPDKQKDVAPVNTNGSITEVKFVAQSAGTYHIYDSQDKPSYFRIYRKDAEYANISGAVDLTQANGIPNDFSVVFTNEAGKSWSQEVTSESYSVDLPIGYQYSISLEGANGYVISSTTTIEPTADDNSFGIDIQAVELYTLTGSITGLGDEFSNAQVTFTPDPTENKIFVPEVAINTTDSTYSVDLEPNCEYTVTAEGVNDFYIQNDKITLDNSDQTRDIAFSAKPTYDISIDAPELTSGQLDKLALTFTNLNEEGYSYTFTDVSTIELRDGTYSISSTGLDEYPLEMGLTSNLSVDGEATSKTLGFNTITDWSFDDKPIEGTSYKGLLFSGAIGSEVSKGHLTGQDGATIQVPVQVGDKINVSYYYTADFSIEGGGQISTNSQSTSNIESVDYVYEGSTDGFVTITIGSGTSTTYITNIGIGSSIEYQEVITVGVDKDYPSINEALDAVSKMNRTSDQRVTVLIDPGNYEEMLVIDVPNVTLKNASSAPSIALQNEGVDIHKEAVRVTSYYGHGYNYYSMGTDQKWDADVLRVNKENGYLSYENKGAGTTNGSYWNATVVVSSPGFEADNIIFENSFNQYISKKESEDIVEMWEVGHKGERPTDYGNTDVQDRSFVERAAAIAVLGSADKTVLNNCRVVGRQDSFYGAGGARVVAYKGAMMGAVDYIFGAMTAVFYKSELVMNVSDVSSDASYITAAQQSSGRGYLMYECTVTSAAPGVESASTYRAKPGYFGRPWKATTSEVVFYNTTVETSNFPGAEGKSLISPEGWKSSLGGESTMMYEYGTIEESGENNADNRASWSTVLSSPKLSDDTDITTFNFTKGSDDWDPLPAFINTDATLSSLIPSIGTLSPAFEPSITSYTLTLPTGSSSVTVTPEATSGDATVENGSFANIPGKDSIIVTAKDGTTKLTYTVDIVTAADTNNSLANLSVSEGTLSPDFSPSVTSYTVEVPAGSNSITVSANAASSAASVEVGSFASIPGSDKVIVTAADGSTKEYTIEVTTAASLPTSVTNNAEEVGVSVNPNPATASTTVNYSSHDEKATISVFSLDGVLVQSFHVAHSSKGKQSHELDLSNLKEGLYIVQILSPSSSEQIKLQVK